MMAFVVVFCTTYALILPVITLERSYSCGLEPHSHSDQCRAGPALGSILCTPEDLGNHEHGPECFDSEDVLRCGLADRILHIHEDICFDPDGQLQCLLPEVPEHLHTEYCYSGEALVCGLEELTDHIHGYECLDEEGNFICGLLETLIHQHDWYCPILEEPIWGCDLVEHIHDDSCVETRLIFGPMAQGDLARLTLDFTIWGPYNPLNFPNGNNYSCLEGDEVTIRIPDTDNNATYNTPDLTVTGCEVVSVTSPCSQNHSSHSHGQWYSCGFAHVIVVRITSTNATVTCSLPGDEWNTNSNSVTITTPGGTAPTAPPVTEPEPTEPPVTEPPVTDPIVTEPEPTEPEPTEPEPTEPEIVRPGYPTPVKTGKSKADTLYFYNFAADGTTVHPLPGCVFRITGTTDEGERFYTTITSGDDLEIWIPDLPSGNYTITEISTPDGYMRDSRYSRDFRIDYSETLHQHVFAGDNTIGSFLNHSLEDLDAGKTAEVEDYNNRTYEIILRADSSVRLYEMEPIDVLFVVDQSNSMLFPSGLTDTGKTITLYQDPQYHEEEGYWRWGRWVVTSPAWHENTTPMDNLGLDKNQVYYIIADPHGTSTVFAVWHDGNSWMYQDASYYAKAWFDNAEGYRQEGELAAFPTAGEPFKGTWTGSDGQTYKANGGDLGYDLGGSLGSYIGDGGSKTFQIYTAVNEYNRLHYLEESIIRALYQLSDANTENTATLIRFTKEVDSANCMGPLELSPANTERMVNAVNKIKTDGGTRQDLGLQHAHDHLTGKISVNDGSYGDHYTKDSDHTFTILITDGAPVRSGSDAPALDQIYQQIRDNGAKVRQESTLITVGLGMDDVEGGRQVLEDIATLPQYANMLQDASDLTAILHDLLFSSLKPKQTQDISGDVTDIISNSFYPIAWVNQGRGSATGRQFLHTDSGRDWIVLEPGDWITLNGQYVGPTQGRNGQGQLLQDDDGQFFIQWQDRVISDDTAWEGRFFVKAKEDFIGGNAIETNTYAAVDVGGSELILPMPTVNVRLLDLNENSSEVTVYLGDLINEPGDSPYDSLRRFYDLTRFTKLVADFPNANGLDYGPILNALDPDEDSSDGLEEDVFYLRYALGGDLTDEQWEYLLQSEEHTVRFDYTYDDDSSHGPVGYFTFRLTKNGDTADYGSHEATQAGQWVEDYTLHVTYTAYELGETSVLDQTQTRPDSNVHNGDGSPGTEVSPQSGNGDLEEGYGIVDKENIHIVNVICGSIELTKQITPELISDTDQTYHFTLLREEDGESQTLEVTVPAGESFGTIRVDGLARGTYVLFEHSSDAYSVRSLEIGPDTNTYSEIRDNAAVFHMGNDPDDRNVIGKWPDDRYTSYTGDPNGVFGEAFITNEKTVQYGQIPVEKIWSDGSENHRSTPIYVVLLQSGEQDTLVLDADGRARLLRLDADNGWTGTFRIALPDKDADPATLGYFVREVTNISTTDTGGTPAILENDGQTVLYFQSPAEPGTVLRFGSDYYMVTYYPDAATGGWTVRNDLAVSLPETGGSGTHLYTFSGLLLTAVSLVLGYNHRRKRERGAAV